MQWFWKHKTDADLFQAGLKKIKRGNIDGAILCWNKTIQLNPQHIDGLLLRGDAKRRQADYIDALSDINRALSFEPNSTEAYYFRTLLELDRNMDSAALASLCQLIHYKYEHNPEFATKLPPDQPYTLQGVLEWLTCLVQNTPANVFVLLARALAFLQLQEFGNALNDLNQAWVIDPTFDVLLLVRGKLLLTCGESISAIEDLTTLIAKGSHNIQAHLLRGQARADTGDMLGARLDFGRVIQLMPKEAIGYTKLAAIHSILGNYPEVLTFADAAIHLNPNEMEAYCYRAVARRVHGDLAGSVADCIYAIQAASDDHLPYMVRAMTFIEARKLDYALKDAEIAVKLAPKRARPYLTRGLVWQYRGDFEKANRDMSEAIRIESDLLEGYRARAEMSEQFGDLIGAMHDYQYLLLHATDPKENEHAAEKIAQLRSAISNSLINSLELDGFDAKPVSPLRTYRTRIFAQS